MKCTTQRITPVIACAPKRFRQKTKLLLFSLFFLSFLAPVFAQQTAKITVSGVVKDSIGNALANATVTEKGTRNATSSGADGRFTIKVAGQNSVLVVSSIGYAVQQITVKNQTDFTIAMAQVKNDMDEVVVVGYGSKKKESLTGAISSVTAKDIDRVHGGATVSTTLAGKLPGVTFRQAEGRPGASASIQIRNMGTPLYVIDGIQQDEGQFNQLAPNDVESITILKDASAAIYGVRAANGVVVVTTKKGTVGKNSINVDAYSGYQSFFRFPKVVNNTADYLYYKADAEMNSYGSTTTTQAILDAAKAGTDPQYRSFDWRKFVLNNNGAPQNSVNVNISGGSDKVSYYVSGTNLFQNSVLGKEYNFNRTNIQSNVTAKLANGLKVGFDINGRVETYKNPGVPGGDDYFLARLAVLRNTPMERPYANDNPLYLNDMGPHLESNYAFLNNNLSGKFRKDWRVLQTNFHIDWDLPWVKGLSVRALGSYYMADELENNQEYTYKAYTYNPSDSSYKATGGSTNPWRDREQIKQINTNMQLQANYNKKFGDHTIGVTAVAERINNHFVRNWIHASPQSNFLPLVSYPIIDQYQDEDRTQARIGYIGRINYNYKNRYFVEGSARRDASYLFAPQYRVGYFPGVSAGWRISEEPFFKKLLKDETKIISNLKFRGSYGVLGDDNPNNNPIVAPFAYLAGYNYGTVGSAVLDGNTVPASRDKGTPVTSISWLRSKITDVGMDFGLLNGKINGSFDWFYRKRTGLLGTKNDVIVPIELGYNLAQQNINSDAQFGEEFSLAYNSTIGKVNFTVGGNVSYTRSKFLQSYNPLFFNSLDQYRNSSEGRYTNLGWGYNCIGQFTSVEQINAYKVDIDGQGNKTLLPGDLIYQDVNGDGKINGSDQRPIGYGYGTQPNINFGFNIAAYYKNFDFHADFSGASGFTWYQNWEQRWAFQNNGNLNAIFEDRWHRADIYDVNSAWIPGKYPANRYNPGTSHSDYNVQSTFWLHNVSYIRARTIEVGYTLPSSILKRAKIQKTRFYLNAYNLFSIDNLSQYGVDPETIDDNGLQFPQNRVINVGINLSL
ncbi:TonB-dependent receptor [Ferruginibacter paludis]|uniref:SusC/RagA family TonB-linked outer membrane protein n=1 Tax=Ferruginibacter paludis TaxID=1310417 RepID=UPI0025B35B88|nr:TonB-dependent receptor [Ferruginibacter paludis]MDN3656869.1 TonB-dependent receptor [Ferruginibacter paludis]